GMNYAPFTVQNPGTPPENIRAPSGLGVSELEQSERIRRRQRLFYDLEDQFMVGRGPHLSTSPGEKQREKDRARFAEAWKAHQDIYRKGFSLVASKEGKVFDLKGEPARLQEDYGNNNFGRAALLARRLVEAGVSAVEISLGGWD